MTTAGVPPTLQNYDMEFLSALGEPVNDANLDALYAVEHLEGANNRYNPLNVIEPEPGSTTFNSAGVQTYPDFDTGVAGAAALFQGSHWAGVRAAMSAPSATVSSVLAAFKAAYTWDPNVTFTDTAAINTAAATQTVGPNAGSGSLAAVQAVYTPGGTQNAILGIPGTPSAADLAKDILDPFLNFALNAVFVVAGLGVVVLGVWKLTSGARANAQQTVEQIAPLAAAAA